MLHISDIKKYNKCPRYYFLSRTLQHNYFNYFRNDVSIIDVYSNLFNISSCFIGKKGDDPNLVIDELGNYDFFINARFAYKDLRVKISLLKKENDGYSLFFFKPFLPKELDTNSIYITLDVLKKNSIHISHINIVYVNKDYILDSFIDYNKALIITDKFNDDEIINIINNHTFEYEKIISDINNDGYNKETTLNKNCCSCELFESCNMNMVEDDSVLHLVSSKYKYDMYEEGIFKLSEADLNRIDGTSLQYAQILASRNNGFYIDRNRIKKFLEKMKNKPICFIDFEWDSFLFPIYKGMKSFGILPFEFCLYSFDENNFETNYSFVGKGDCREEFIIELIKHIPNDGPIVAYNSFSAEVLRINELADQFPKYKNQLTAICNRFVDIAEVFSKGMLYDIRFKGQLTLKRIVSTVSDISYSNLKVKDGLEAIKNFREYELSNDEKIKNDLIEYCNQDAYSLVIIYNYLNQLV